MAGKRPPETNTVQIDGDVAYIDVSTASFPSSLARVDVADLPLVINGRGRWYAARSRGALYAKRNRPGTTDLMHRVLCPSMLVDHENGDGLDNRRSNLRPATHAENARNRVSHQGSSSRFKGVSFDRRRRKWLAQLWLNGRPKFRAAFSSEEDAARAYDAAAREHHGAFAKTNFVEAAGG